MARTGFKPLNQASAETGSGGTTRNEVVRQRPAWKFQVGIQRLISVSRLLTAEIAA